MTYALGRGVDYQDMLLGRFIAHDSARNGTKFSDVWFLDIVKKKPFLMNMKMETSVPCEKEKGN